MQATAKVWDRSSETLSEAVDAMQATIVTEPCASQDPADSQKATIVQAQGWWARRVAVGPGAAVGEELTGRRRGGRRETEGPVVLCQVAGQTADRLK